MSWATPDDPLDLLKRSRAGMLVSSPFFGELAFQLTLKEDKMENIPEQKRTMWTDGVTLGYSPDYVLKQSPKVLEFSLAHEAMHCALGHHLRRNGRDPEMWNKACDYSVNWSLKESGYEVPKWALLDEKYANKAAEEIFEILKGKRDQEQEEKKQDQQEEKDEQDSSDSGEDKDESTDEDNENADDSDSEGEDEGEDTGEGSDTGEGQDDGQEESDQDGDGEGEGEGSGAGEGEGGAEGEGQGDCEGGCGEIRDYPGGEGVDKGDAEAAQEQQWKSLTAMAQQHAEGCGKCPGYISQMVPELIASKVDWREVLQRFVAEKAKNDYSWNHPNARYAHTGFILPGLHDEQLPPIVFAIDTSGSTATDLSQFASEGEELMAVYPTTLTVIMADTEVRDVKEYTKEDIPLNLEFKGGGGTKFRPTFQYVNEMDVEPTCVIYMTDLDCYDFGPEPPYPVLFIQTEGPARTAPWGEVVRMKSRF